MTTVAADCLQCICLCINFVPVNVCMHVYMCVHVLKHCIKIIILLACTCIHNYYSRRCDRVKCWQTICNFLKGYFMVIVPDHVEL